MSKRNNRKNRSLQKKRESKNKKRYSSEEKIKYFKSRENNPGISQAKQVYARFWLMGFFDPHAKHNINAAQHEREVKLRNGELKDKAFRAIFDGDIAGMKERNKLDGLTAQSLTDKYAR